MFLRLHGQWLTAADQDAAWRTRRVMLSYGYWQRRFGGDPRCGGPDHQVDSQPRVIAGVMPRGFKVVNYDFDLLVPLAFDPVEGDHWLALPIAASGGCGRALRFRRPTPMWRGC